MQLPSAYNEKELLLQVAEGDEHAFRELFLYWHQLLRGYVFRITELKEVGKVVSKCEDMFDVTVKYFEGSVDFVQVVKLKANVKTNISGKVEFMVCNDHQCLPPSTVNFSILLK